jgi:hypothetical protein
VQSDKDGFTLRESNSQSGRWNLTLSPAVNVEVFSTTARRGTVEEAAGDVRRYLQRLQQENRTGLIYARPNNPSFPGVDAVRPGCMYFKVREALLCRLWGSCSAVQTPRPRPHLPVHLISRCFVKAQDSMVQYDGDQVDCLECHAAAH